MEEGKTQTSSQGSKQKPCKFFASEEGCRFGDKCRFSHDPLGDKTPSEPDSKEKKLKENSKQDGGTASDKPTAAQHAAFREESSHWPDHFVRLMISDYVPLLRVNRGNTRNAFRAADLWEKRVFKPAGRNAKSLRAKLMDVIVQNHHPDGDLSQVINEQLSKLSLSGGKGKGHAKHGVDGDVDETTLAPSEAAGSGGGVGKKEKPQRARREKKEKGDKKGKSGKKGGSDRDKGSGNAEDEESQKGNRPQSAPEAEANTDQPSSETRPVSATPQIRNMATVTRAAAAAPEVTPDMEFGQVKRRFAQSYKLIKDGPPKVIRIAFKPSDPDFPFDVELVYVRITIPAKYPEEPCGFEIINYEDPDIADIPENLCKNVERAMNAKAVEMAGKIMMKPLLKYLDNNLESLLVDKRVTQQFELSRAGVQVVPSGQQALAAGHASAAPPIADRAREAQPQKKIALAKGTQFKLEGLNMTGAGIVMPKRLRLTMSCHKCSARVEVKVTQEDEFKELCPGCYTQVVVEARMEALHEFSAIGGYLDVVGLSVLDVRPSDFEASCFECSERVMLKKVQRGKMHEARCHTCHKPITFVYDGISFIQQKAGAGTSGKEERVESAKAAARKRAQIRKDEGIVVGQPLPDKGSCQHYKKSHRWLRFPCCGAAYPCDVCHDEKVAGEHEMAYANSMICGFCSREQNFSNKPCVCGAALTADTSSAHWEGGKGCRDRTKMSTNDSKKYAGLGKTESKKHERVGKKK